VSLTFEAFIVVDDPENDQPRPARRFGAQGGKKKELL